AAPDILTLSLHDALPICRLGHRSRAAVVGVKHLVAKTSSLLKRTSGRIQAVGDKHFPVWESDCFARSARLDEVPDAPPPGERVGEVNHLNRRRRTARDAVLPCKQAPF